MRDKEILNHVAAKLYNLANSTMPREGVLNSVGNIFDYIQAGREEERSSGAIGKIINADPDEAIHLVRHEVRKQMDKMVSEYVKELVKREVKECIGGYMRDLQVKIRRR